MLPLEVMTAVPELLCKYYDNDEVQAHFFQK